MIFTVVGHIELRGGWKKIFLILLHGVVSMWEFSFFLLPVSTGFRCEWFSINIPNWRHSPRQWWRNWIVSIHYGVTIGVLHRFHRHVWADLGWEGYLPLSLISFRWNKVSNIIHFNWWWRQLAVFGITTLMIKLCSLQNKKKSTRRQWTCTQSFQHKSYLFTKHSHTHTNENREGKDG